MKSRLSFAVLICSVVLALFSFSAAVPTASAQIQVLAADPPSAERGTVNLNVLIKGKGFKKGAAAEWFVSNRTPLDTGGVRVNSTAFVDATTLRANIDVADTAVLSKFDIVVRNSDGRTGKGIEMFTVNEKGVSACVAPPPVPEGGVCFSSIPGVPGCLDRSFGSGTGQVLAPRGFWIKGLAIQILEGEERFVAVGMLDEANLDPCVGTDGAIVRYRSDGTLDPTFGVGGVVITTPLAQGDALMTQAVVVQPDNKLIVVGRVSVEMPAPRGNKPLVVKVPAVARYDQNGLLDPTFGNGGLVTVTYDSYRGYAAAATLQTDGKIVLTGEFPSTNHRLAVIRLNPDGSLDSTFNGTGIFSYSSEYSSGMGVTTQMVGSEERIVVAGLVIRTYTYYSAALLRLTPAGVLDTEFGGTGVVLADHPPLPDGGYNGGDFYGVAVDSNNRIVAGGTLADGSQLARYDEFGNLDLTFGEGGFVFPPLLRSQEFANALAMQPDGHILLVGASYQDNSNTLMITWRFTPDGAPDLAFGDNGRVLNGFFSNGPNQAFTLVLQSDGKLVAAGRAGYNDGTNWLTYGALARYWTY